MENGMVCETSLEEQVREALRGVFDPEIPVNIVDLGLVYEIHVDAGKKHAHVLMTLTAPNCPVAELIPSQAKKRVKSVPGIETAEVDLVFDPPWSMENMSEAAKLQLGML